MLCFQSLRLVSTRRQRRLEDRRRVRLALALTPLNGRRYRFRYTSPSSFASAPSRCTFLSSFLSLSSRAYVSRPPKKQNDENLWTFRDGRESRPTKPRASKIHGQLQRMPHRLPRRTFIKS